MDRSEGVTIIHGPNGFGKTVMLKMIAGALQGDASIFRSIPFEEFRLDLDDGRSWILRSEKPETEAKEGIKHAFRLFLRDPLGAERLVELAEAQVTPAVIQILSRIDRVVPGPYARFRNGWRDSTGKVYSLSQILQLFPAARKVVSTSDLEMALGGTWEPLGIHVFVVEANRLTSTDNLDRSARLHLSTEYYDDPDTVVPTTPRIDQYSADIVQRIKNVRSDYAKVSQERDSTFPERLVHFMRAHNEPFQEADVVAKLADLDRKRQNLIALGFLDKEKVVGSFKEEDVKLAREALTIYVGDVETKLSAFDEMASRTGKLMQIIKRRFQYKKLRISREQGFVVESDAGDRVRLADLSSGEQHQLIVLYELLFRTPSNGLILVDEPEISLHVGWQTHFLPDLIEILKLNGAYALVATHSPVLIGNQWGLTKELDGPVQDHGQGRADA